MQCSGCSKGYGRSTIDSNGGGGGSSVFSALTELAAQARLCRRKLRFSIIRHSRWCSPDSKDRGNTSRNYSYRLSAHYAYPTTRIDCNKNRFKPLQIFASSVLPNTSRSIVFIRVHCVCYSQARIAKVAAELALGRSTEMPDHFWS
jgi:hypothetical protein